MSNSEPVYQHRGQTSEVFDTAPLNMILSNYHLGEVTCSDTEKAMMKLRHQLLALLKHTPESKDDFLKLVAAVQPLLVDKIWCPEDRTKISDICERHWRSKLIKTLSGEAVDSVKTKLSGLPVFVRADIGFAILQHTRQQTPTEEFVLEKIVPLLMPLKLPQGELGKACRIIHGEYAQLAVLF